MLKRVKCANYNLDLEVLEDEDSAHTVAIRNESYGDLMGSVSDQTQAVQNHGWKDLCELKYRFHVIEWAYKKDARGSKCSDSVCDEKKMGVFYKPSVP